MTNRLGIFVDVGNLYHCCLKKYNRKINYEKLFKFCSFGFEQISHAVAYGVGSTNNSGFKKCLYEAGFKRLNFKTPKVFADKTKKADQDLLIATDIFKALDDFDTLVLVTADGDFAPVVKLCIEKQKKVAIIGCLISAELKDLTTFCYEIKEDLLEPDSTTE